MRPGYDKRLMVFSGRADPGLAAAIAHQLGAELGPVTLKTFSNHQPGTAFTAFGRGSATRHLEQGAWPILSPVPTLRRDVDVVSDLDGAAALGVGRRTRVLHQSLLGASGIEGARRW
ncbi:hypothetical protein GCM10017577_74980 [Pseudonocardia halophobica]|uniref:Ribose-phosphate pyrophosphokinase n=1 Tax=Pseudonocardia halophobica TaxID=29401 RepID=A0A9W6P1Y9_9PSEU|nr:hypothetical protein GCM10017577_74980 [Pseudonocardia halophobica]